MHIGQMKYRTSVYILLYSFVLFCSVSYNGALPHGDKGRRRSKFSLFMKPTANGVKPVKQHKVKNPQQSEVHNLDDLSLFYFFTLFLDLYTN